MSSLVSDFFINPVLRQARRLSELSRTTFSGDVAETLQQPDAVTMSDHADESVDDSSMITSESPQSRPLSSSTQETRLEDTNMAPAVVDVTARDHLGFPISPKKGHHIPEDDGMRQLRSFIQAINASETSSSEKARLIHEAMLAGYRASIAVSRTKDGDTVIAGTGGQVFEQSAASGPLESLRFWQNQLGESATPEKFVLTKSDITPTYIPVRQPRSTGTDTPPRTPSSPLDGPRSLGCQHYERNVKLQCSTCKKWYTCRFCHDAQEDHTLIRKETKNMLCMLCATPQRASDVCINCGETAAHYYCNICKLWENRQHKPVYHCNDCGICRRGMGLGKDFFHCKTCRACITTSIESSHKCIERSTDCDCPICGEYMFTSTKPVVFMTCGHSIHKRCYDQHMKVSYKCPICNKSLANMETQFRNLDVAIISQPMPPEFRDTKASILCNDCSGRSTVPYHWLGLKCFICRSYNTVELQIFGGNGQQLQTASVPIATAQVIQEQTRDIARPGTSHLGPPGSGVANRRRHSSHASEFQHAAPDRVARSLSPAGIESLALQGVQETDSEDDSLGFWGGANDDEEGDGSSGMEESESDDGDSDDMESDDDDNDDEDDEIMLIGHR